MPTIAPNTRSALIRLAGHEDRLSIGEGRITIDNGAGYAATARQLNDGRWIVAQYDARRAQYQSSDMQHPDRNFAYAFSRSLEGLAEYGVRTYSSPVDALRANLPHGADAS